MMKWKIAAWVLAPLLLGVVGGYFLGARYGHAGRSAAGTATGTGGDREILYWQSPMDPSYIRNEPGKSPMGMDLVPVYADQEGGEAGLVEVDPVVALNMGVRTDPAVVGNLVRKIRTVAHIVESEDLLYQVTNKFDGWLEVLHVEKTGAEVSEGETLFEIYSPELVQAQVSYLESLADPRLHSPDVSEQERARARSLVDSTRQRFRFWDVPESWIVQLEQERQMHRTVPVVAPSSGVVLEKIAVQGAYFKAGTMLYRIASLEQVWAIASVYEYELPFVHAGQPVSMTLSYLPGRIFRGHIDYIYPYVNPTTRDVSIRIVLPNEDSALLPGMFADVMLRGQVKESAVLVPDSAIISTGARQLVFVERGEGKFEARDVRIGVRGEDGMREVLHGIAPGETIVVSGQFMLDSESRIREAIRKFAAPGQKAAAGHTHPPAEEALPAEAPATGDRAGVPPSAALVGDVIYLNNATCPVKGGEVDGSLAVVWQGMRVELCCPGCDLEFLNDPPHYLASIGVDPDRVKAAFLKGAPPAAGRATTHPAHEDGDEPEGGR